MLDDSESESFDIGGTTITRGRQVNVRSAPTNPDWFPWPDKVVSFNLQTSETMTKTVSFRAA